MNSPLTHPNVVEYLKMGWSVIPIFWVNGECGCGNVNCSKPGKHPQVYWTKYQLERATPEEMADWVRRWDTSNVGIVTGAISGIFVVDADGEEGETNLRSKGILPTTPTIKTSRGYHYYFNHPGYDIQTRTNLFPKVDIRGDGGYVVTAPSAHISGIDYQWVSGLEPWSTPLAYAPQWLLEAMLEKGKKGKGKKPVDIAGLVEEGKRNDTLVRLAGSMRRGGLPESTITLALVDVNEKYCDPPLSYNEIETIAHSVAKYEPAEIIGSVENAYLSYGANDEGNARCVAKLYGDQLAYNSRMGWLDYTTGTHWKRQEGGDTTTRVVTDVIIERKKAAQQADYESVSKFCVPNASRVKATIAQLASLLILSTDSFNSEKDLLNVANGTLDLRTGELRPHNSDDHFMYCAPTEYHPSAVSHIWEEFLSEVVGDYEQMKDYLQMAVGYSLTGHQKEECFFFLKGRRRSGKGTFTQTLLNILGSPLAVGADFASLSEKREADANNFDLAGLVQTRFLVCGEVSRYLRLGPKRLKTITGQDTIRASHKYMEPFEYYPQFKAWLLSNWDVNIDPDDEALWGRVKVITFPTSFYGREDTTLKERMLTPENREGILAWAVQGAMNWYKSTTGLVTPYEVERETEKHREELDTVGRFLAENYESTELEAHFVSNADLYKDYSVWCVSNGVDFKEKLPQRLLTESLKTKGFEVGVTRRMGKSVHRGVTGIKKIVEVGVR